MFQLNIVSLMLTSQIFIIISMKLVIALICLCVTQVNCIKFIIHVSRADGPKCFYEFLSTLKYKQMPAKSTVLLPRAWTPTNLEWMSIVRKVINGKKCTKNKYLIPSKALAKWPAAELPICFAFLIWRMEFWE